MNPDPHNIHTFMGDLRRAWRSLKHGKVAKWTLTIHFVYYAHATALSTGWDHIALSGACALAILFDVFAEAR